MKDKCLRCYWFKGVPDEYDYCFLSWHPDFDCTDDFEPIDDEYYDWLVNHCEVPKDCLVKRGQLYEWKIDEF